MHQPDNGQVNDILKDVKIPPSPEILTRLNAELQKDDPELATIAAILQKDAGLSALVIRTVNSPLFPLRTRVTSISQAISLLGLGYTINIVMGLVLRQTFDSDDYELTGFWESPNNIALIMSRLSRSVAGLAADEAYMTGLFHNVGHTLIRQRFPDYHEFYIEHLNHPERCITAFEQQRYNFDHATLGYYLARSWGLPADICQVILNHHNAVEMLEKVADDEAGERIQRLLALLKLAEHIVTLFFWRKEDHEWVRCGDSVLHCLGLSEPDYQDIEADMLELLETDAG